MTQPKPAVRFSGPRCDLGLLPSRLDTTRTKASTSGTRPHLQAVPPSAFGADRGVPHVEGAEGVEVDIDPMAHNWTRRNEESGQERREIAGPVRALVHGFYHVIDRLVYELSDSLCILHFTTSPSFDTVDRTGFEGLVRYSRNFYNAKTIMQKSDNARVWASTEFVPI